MKELHDYINIYMPRTHGWCTQGKATAISDWVLKNRPQFCVEIGVFAGRSLVAMALALKENGSGVALGIDPWSCDASADGFKDENAEWWKSINHEEMMHHCDALVKIFGVQPQAQMVRMTNRAAIHLPILRHTPIDLLHIDGNHSEQSSVFDVENYVPLVRSGGSVWFDDTDWQTTKKAQTILLKSCEQVGMVGTCAILRKL